MRSLTFAGGVAVPLVALGLTMTGCGSDTEESAASSSPSSQSSSSSGPSTSTAAPDAAGAHETIADYIAKDDITETPVRRGDQGAPTVDLPTPAGWEDAGLQTPEGAYSAIVFRGDPAATGNPPAIVMRMSKLSGKVDQAKIFEFAGGELKNLPGFTGMGEGPGAKLSGFDTFQIGGTYQNDGGARMVAQKTVVIPAKDGDGVYVLQLNASGTEQQMNPLMSATADIDQKMVITP